MAFCFVRGRRFKRVEILSAVPRGIPECGGRYGETEFLCAFPCGKLQSTALRLFCETQGQGKRCLFAGVEFDLNGEDGVRTFERLADGEMLDACRSFCEIKRVVESADGQTDSPVPPAGGLYFAEELQIRNGIVVILSERFAAQPGAAVCLGGYGFEFDFQCVLSGFEQVSCPCAETDEHVVAAAQKGSVQPDVRAGVC